MRLRFAAIAVGLVALGAAPPLSVLPPAPVEPLSYFLTTTAGPPATSCANLLTEAAVAKKRRGPWSAPAVPAVPRSRPPIPAERPLDAALVRENVQVSWASVTSGALPGADPAALGLQPLEGDFYTLERIGNVFRSAARGEAVRISTFGASHTGGDYFTGALRRSLQERYGDRGHGFVFPASLYEGDRAHDIHLCSSPGWTADWVGRKNSRWDGLFGFGGASVSTSDPLDFAFVETNRDGPFGRSWSRIQLWAVGQPGGGQFSLVVDDAEPILVNTQRPRAELVHVVVDVPAGPHRATVRPVGDGEVRLLGLSGELDEPGVLLDAIGVRGRTARTWLEFAPELRDPGLVGIRPDLIILAYGTNEAADTDYAMVRYREDLRDVLRIVRRDLPRAACILIGPSDRATVVKKGQQYAIWGRTAPVAQVQREVAPEFGCAFWDWQQAQGGPGAMLSWRAAEPPLAGWDFIHFSQAGYTRSAELFLAALDDAVAVTGGATPLQVR